MDIGTLLEFCIATAKAHPAPAAATTLEETKTYQEQEQEKRMDVSHPFKFTSVFLPNRMDVGFEKYQTMHQHQHQQSSMEL
jgi:hypothetical protein